ncbi:MAG: DUF3575 domain-containing protein [Rikenellaceae bacterium]
MSKTILKGLFGWIAFAIVLLAAPQVYAQRTHYTQRDIDQMISNADTVIYRYHDAPAEKYREAYVLENQPPALDWSLRDYPQRTLFAVKTNLLYDAITAINIELEVPIGLRYSISGEWIFPWWLSDSRQRSFELLCGTLKGRYWLGDRATMSQLTGWSAGLYVGGGYYDLEWDGDGYQGEYLLSGGISAAYAHSIGGNFRLEYSLGLGILATKYRKYKAQECGYDWNLLRIHRGTNRWFGPTQLGVSLCYMLHRADKRGGER